MAVHVELSEVARHALRRRRNLRQGGGRGDREQVPDPGIRGRRDRSGAAGGGCGDQRHGRDVPHRLLLLRRQGSDLRAALRRAVRAQRAHAECLGVFRGRHRSDQRVLQEIQHLRAPGRQHRLPDGRLVPQGDQGAGRFQRAQDAHRRLRRPGAAEARVRAAAARRRRHLSGAGKRHHRRRRMGRPVRRREARLLQGRAVLLLSGLVGRRNHDSRLHQHRQVEFAEPDLQVDRSHRGRHDQRLDAGEIRRREPGRLAAPRRREDAIAAVLAAGHGRLLQGRQGPGVFVCACATATTPGCACGSGRYRNRIPRSATTDIGRCGRRASIPIPS